MLNSNHDGSIVLVFIRFVLKRVKDISFHLSPLINLGIMSDGVFFPTLGPFISPIRENYSRQERLEEEVIELRAVALAPNAAVLIVDKTFTFYGKDGSTYTSPIVQTYVAAEVDGEWKFIHVHMSTPHQPG